MLPVSELCFRSLRRRRGQGRPLLMPHTAYGPPKRHHHTDTAPHTQSGALSKQAQQAGGAHRWISDVRLKKKSGMLPVSWLLDRYLCRGRGPGRPIIMAHTAYGPPKRRCHTDTAPHTHAGALFKQAQQASRAHKVPRLVSWEKESGMLPVS